MNTTPIPDTAPAWHTGLETEALLCEVSWEVCQQLGGIQTVIRSKAPVMVRDWGLSYCMVGPFNPSLSHAEFEECTPTGPFGSAVTALRDRGFEAYFGHWLVTGKPQVVLLDPRSIMNKIDKVKYFLWEKHHIPIRENEELIDQVVAFGALMEEFLAELTKVRKPVIAHFHEWMAASAIPAIRQRNLEVAIVFTTHATQLGRYVATADQFYYDHLPFMNWEDEAKRFNIESKVLLERAAAHGAHIMTTVSDTTAEECRHLVGRAPDVLLPNGLNIQRFAALHEFQVYHRQYKEKIHEFVMGHFFPSYTFDLDRTLYFFISGRYEYGNKGFDLTIESMARLNWRMKQERVKATVVFFIVTKAPYKTVNSEVLRSHAVLEEIRDTCEAIEKQVGQRLFVAAAGGVWPELNDLVDDYWKLRLRRTQHAWKSRGLPTIVTHIMENEHDAILSQLRKCQLLNQPEDPVKVVYHPDFINAHNPLFSMDYDQFVRGCHLGIFPSAYEPWGYAPLECMALGVPSITSDLTGFGSYLKANIPDHDQKGLVVIKRRQASFDQSANELTDWLMRFTRYDRRERIAMRNAVESCSDHFDWKNLGRYYAEAHRMALHRFKAEQSPR
ncbi:MAG: glycogen/starch synthase [Planctomycetota bacterium]